MAPYPPIGGDDCDEKRGKALTVYPFLSLSLSLVRSITSWATRIVERGGPTRKPGTHWNTLTVGWNGAVGQRLMARKHGCDGNTYISRHNLVLRFKNESTYC